MWLIDVVIKEFAISCLLGKLNVDDREGKKFFGKWTRGLDDLYVEIYLGMAEPEGGESNLSVWTTVTVGMHIIQA